MTDQVTMNEVKRAAGTSGSGRRSRLWIGICVAVTLVAVASSAGIITNHFSKESKFVSWLGMKIQNVNDVVARRFDCNGALIEQVTDDAPADASRDAPISIQRVLQGKLRNELKRPVYMGIVLLKTLVSACLKRLKHVM